MEDDKSGTKKLLILYASETGNAMDAAERLGREAERRRCPAAVRSVDELNPKSLPSEETVIFVVSTTGQGDVPDSMKGFWRFLLQKNLSERWLEEVDYAVFGLGDSSYQKYNFVAKKLDKRLLGLGANAIIERFLQLTMDIASASPRRYFFEIMSLFANAQHEKERLEYFASSEGRDDLYQYNQKERRTVLEVLEDFPSVQMPFEWL